MIQAENPFDSADLVARWRANAERRAAFLQAATDRMLDAAGVVAGAHVLDLGTGTGDTAVFAGLRVGPEGRVLATDVSEAMLQAAAETASAAGLQNVECRRLDAADLAGLEPGSFDSVIARFSLMFVDDLDAALGGITRALKPGGRLGALVWGPAERNAYNSMSLRVARREGLLRVPDVQVTRPFRLGSSEKLAEAARAAGMEAGVQEVPVELLARTPDSALEGMRATSITQLILGALTETEQARLEAAMRAEMETYREGDCYRFPGLALLLEGRKLALTS
jgi:ubiquinone/menaquinone biosynthesis C-methylase UbiE